jgi:hypothetical protein
VSDSWGFVDLGRPLWREDGSVVCNCYWLSPAQSFSGSSLVGLVAIYYCLRFETSLFVASYDSQGHGGGIQSRLHTGKALIESESESYVTTDGQPASLSWNKAPIWGLRPDLCYCLKVAVCWFGAPSLTRGRVCRLQLLLALASAVIFGSESRRTHGHILLSQIWEFPFRRLLRLAGSLWRYSIRPPHGEGSNRVELSWVECYVTTDGQPASLSWYKAPIWGLRPDLYYLYDNYGLILVGRPLWREDGSDFYICCWALPAQSFFGHIWPYFSVSHLRLPFSSSPTTRRVTVEVFDPASTRGFWTIWVWILCYDRQSYS